MAKKKTNKVVGSKGKDGKIHYSINFTKGEWFNPLIQNQVVEGALTKVFTVDSKFKNTRENSNCFGKKAKTAYEITRGGGKVPLCLSETSGPVQSMLDDLNIGDFIHLEFKCLKREDGELCPKTVKSNEQLKKWKGRLKAWPVWGDEAWVKEGRSR